MAPIKFEENIKDKLEQRGLKPSPDAWNKLVERLDSESKRNTNKTYWWLGIAASFVGLLIVSSILFSKGAGENISTPVLVEEEMKTPIEVKNDIIEDIVEEEKTIENQVASEGIKTDSLKSNKLIVNNKSERIVLTQENPIQEDIIETIAYNETNKVAIVESIKTPEDKKVDEVVKLIQELQKEKSSVTDAEIDALLNQAQEELFSQRLYNKSTKTVDAELLLLQVETDLDHSFRDRVFDALKTGYKKVKTAVAERNN